MWVDDRSESSLEVPVETGPDGEQHRCDTEHQADGQPVGNQLSDREVPKLKGWPAIAVQQAAHVAAKLKVDGLVEPIGRFEIRADLRRQRLFLVKRAAQLPLPAGAPIPPDSRLPYDAILFVTLRRP